MLCKDLACSKRLVSALLDKYDYNLFPEENATGGSLGPELKTNQQTLSPLSQVEPQRADLNAEHRWLRALEAGETRETWDRTRQD